MSNIELKTDIMVDIETLHNSVNSAITQIGAVHFNIATGEVYDTFKVTIDLQSCLNVGLEIKAETLAWWLEENAALLKSIISDKSALNIKEGLFEFRKWLESKNPSTFRIWGNSNRFDLGIIANAYDKANQGKALPWQFFLERDVRTLTDLPNILHQISYPTLEKSFINEIDYKSLEIELAIANGVRHEPVEDCIVQINYVTKILKNLSELINE